MASPQALLISAVLNTGDGSGFTRNGITDEMMTDYADEFAWLVKYIDRYNATPGIPAFENAWPDFRVKAGVVEVDHYADDTKHAYARATITELLDKSVDLIVAGQIDKAIDGLGTDLLRVQAVVQDSADDYDLVSDWHATYEKAKERIARVKTHGSAGVPTGFTTLDLLSGGWQPGWYGVIGGRLSAGKTWTMVRSATAAAMAGYTSLYFSLEQPRDQIAIRTHTMFSHQWHDETFRHLDLMRGQNYDLRSYRAFLEQMEDNLAGRFVINDTSRGRVGPIQVAAAIEREQPDVVFIDYLTLMKTKGDGDWLSVADLSASIQQLGQRYNVPIICGAQLNRTAMRDDEPDAGMIGRSDAVGQDADIAVMVSKKSESVRKMSLAKFRHGPDGVSWFVKWKPNTGEVYEVNGDEAADLIEKDKAVD